CIQAFSLPSLSPCCWVSLAWSMLPRPRPPSPASSASTRLTLKLSRANSPASVKPKP
ncbi:hypothetical protein, partial [Pseudomonas sp. FEN]